MEGEYFYFLIKKKVVVVFFSNFVLMGNPSSTAVTFPNKSLVVCADCTHYYIDVINPQMNQIYAFSKLFISVSSSRSTEYETKTRCGGRKFFYKTSDNLYLDNYGVPPVHVTLAHVNFTK